MPDDRTVRILIACAVLIAVLLAGAMIVLWVKKHFWGPDSNNETVGTGFTLGDLRQLHKAGKMTDAEFEKARSAVVAAAKRAAARVEKRETGKSDGMGR
jgi:hypothetical protein